MINELLGEKRLRTREVREKDARGRHTTTHRQMIPLPALGVIIDMPGMREMQLWHADEGMSESFEDIEELAAGCRFGDCSHQGEPGCAVLRALEEGRLSPDRLERYRKLERELTFLARKTDKRLRAEQPHPQQAVAQRPAQAHERKGKE